MPFPFQDDNDELGRFPHARMIGLVSVSVLALVGLWYLLPHRHEAAEGQPESREQQAKPAEAVQQPDGKKTKNENKRDQLLARIEARLDAIERRLNNNNRAPNAEAAGAAARPTRRRADPKPKQYETMIVNVRISYGSLPGPQAPVVYGPVDVADAHAIMQQSIIQAEAHQPPPLTRENSGEKNLEKALADGWEIDTTKTKTSRDSSGGAVTQYHLRREFKGGSAPK